MTDKSREGEPMRPEDTRKFQTNRLNRLFSERASGKRIEFDEMRTFVRFRITDLANGVVLVASSGEWEASVLADKSDDELWRLIQQLSGGKL
jgi:dihydrodipicolinate synthase/N-acetylneuraminate lyase